MSYRLWHLAAHHTTIIRYQRYGLLLLAAVGLLLMVGWGSAPNRLSVYLPPDLSAGITQDVTHIPPAYVYSFAYQLWQELNYWPSASKQDNGHWAYQNNLDTYRPYLSADFYTHLQQDANAQARAQKLARTRSLQPLQGATFAREAITPVNATTWIVQLDLHLIERANGITVKDTQVRYPLMVTRTHISHQHNPYGLALSGFAHPPQRLNNQ